MSKVTYKKTKMDLKLKMPNEITLKTIKNTDKNKDLNEYKNLKEFKEIMDQ